MINFVWILTGGGDNNEYKLQKKTFSLVEYIEGNLFLSEYRYSFHLSLSLNHFNIIDRNEISFAIKNGKKFLVKFNQSEYGYYIQSKLDSKSFDIVYFDKETSKKIQTKLIELMISECMFIF